MNAILAVVAALLAIAPQGLFGWKWRRFSLLAVLCSLLPVAAAIKVIGSQLTLPMLIAYGVGVIAAAVGSQLLNAETPVPSGASALAIAALTRILMSILPGTASSAALVCMLIGCSACAILLDLAEGSTVFMLPVAMASVLGVDLLGPWGLEPAGLSHGAIFGLMASALAGVGTLFSRFGKEGKQRWLAVLLMVGLAALYWTLARNWTPSVVWTSPWSDLRGAEHPVWQIFAASLFSALVVNWLWPRAEHPDTFQMAVALVIWCGLATLAFGLDKGFGVALALLGSVGTLLLLGNARALSSLAPLVVIALYRILRQTVPGVDRAIDIGQHYAVVGLLLGTTIPALPIEWVRTHVSPEGKRSVLGVATWILLLLSVPAIAAIAIGDKGLSAMLMGLAVAPVLGRFRDARACSGVTASILVASAIVLSWGWLASLLDLSRDEKLHSLLWPGVIVAIGALLLVLLHGKASSESVSEAA